MKIIRARELKFIPASHEDPQDPGVWKKVLLKKEDFPWGQIQMINWSRLPVGRFFQPHYHENMEEVFIILKGNAKIKVGEEEALLEKDDAVVISPKEIHTMENTGKEEVDYLALGVATSAGGQTRIVELVRSGMQKEE